MPNLQEPAFIQTSSSLAAATSAASAHLGRTITDIFEEQAERSPERVALVYDQAELTYTELDRCSNRLAHYLRACGVEDGDRVGICVERSLDMIIGLLGILKAGAAYVPLDPNYPQERLECMAADAGLKVLLIQQRFASRIALPEVPQVVYERERFKIEKQPDRPPRSKATSEYPAYLIYTSGSTGTPKGVCIAHRNVVRLVVNTSYADLDRDQVFLQFAPISFDAAAFEIWGALLNGARLIIFPAGTPSAEELGEWLFAHEVTTLWLTAGLFHQMMESDDGRQFRRVRQLLAGGDVLLPSLVHKFLQHYPGCRLINGYGPTENATFSTCGDLRGTPADGTSVSIGRPIANSTVHVLGEDMQPVPYGEFGEMYLGGAGLAHGYWNEPVLTAEKFVPNPFSGVAGDRLYRSGDLGRFLPDGTLEFAGRMDHQVKLRGFRIELAEIELCLSQHSKIAQAVVALRTDEGRDKFLAAYVVARGRRKVQDSELREYLRSKLPEYMVPSAFMFLPKLPLTPNGKVDRRALPAPHCTPSVLLQGYDAPATDTESRLCAIWAEALSIDKVGASDNFFDLGGDSLLASRILSRIRSAFGVLVPLQMFFEQPVVNRLARIIEVARKEKSAKELPGLASVPRGEEIPLGCSQERVWFLQQLDPSSVAYHFQATLQISGVLNLEALQRSLTSLVLRHEILRTTFVERDGHVIQRIHEPFPVTVRLVHLDQLDKERRDNTVERLIQDEVRKRFDLSHLPLIRWTLFSLAENEHLLLHVEHHLIHDGWSFNVFLSELLELYKCYSSGSASSVSPPAMQFADFALWQQQCRDSEAMKAQLSYWKQKLLGAPPRSEVPVDYSRPRVQSFTGGLLRIPLSAELSRAVRSFSRREEVSLFVVMMSAFFALMSYYTRQDDFCVGSSMANRQRRETEAMLGMLVNNVVLRARLSKQETFRELVREIRNLAFEAYENQDVPFQDVVQALNLNRDLSANPLFQTTFNFHNSPVAVPDIPDLKLRLLEGVANGGAKFDLGVIVIPSTEQRQRLNREWSKDTITMLWEYNSDLFHETTVRRMITHYMRLLKKMIAAPEERVGEVCLLTDAERRQILNRGNATTLDYSQPKCVHELFEEHARSNSEATAVIFGGRELSYGELNSQANRLAQYLRTLGVRPNLRVAISVDRGFEMIVGLLAILKSGGAFVPLDPSYPLERLRYMLEDSAPVLLLTQGDLLSQFRRLGVEQQLVDLSEGLPPWCDQPDTNLRPSDIGLTPGHPSYLIYTSGSTGKPKGVVIEHRGVCNLAKCQRDAFSVTPECRILQFASLSFDACVWELVMALCQGAALCLGPPRTVLTGENLRDVITTNRVTHATLPPVLLASLPESSVLDSVDTLIVAGDSLSNALASRWARGRKLINAYGPTEATVCTTMYFYRGKHGAANVSIGRPLPNTRVYILDDQGQPVPVAVIGELYIGGAGLAQGYFNRPELTAEKFVPDMFSGSPGARMYRTGDLCRWNVDGTIDFLGRKDFQVKVRGFRVELGEIEAALAEYPGVQEAAVAAMEDETGAKQLIAYYRGAAGPGYGEGEMAQALQAHLSARLPAYMLPAAYVLMDRFPVTENRKLDRKSLPPPRADSYARRRHELPIGDMETTLAAIFENVLKVERLGRHDSFFELGGHSLLATKLISRVRSLLGVELAIQNIFEFPTVAALAPMVEELILDDLAGMSEEEAAEAADLLADQPEA
jgi:amino acid adenylation domain-containing protein